MTARLRKLMRVSELRAVGDPIRIEVLRLLGADLDRALTAKDLAAELDVRLSLMHYHLKILCDEQLVVAERGDNAQGRPERRFRAAQSALRWDFPEECVDEAGPCGDPPPGQAGTSPDDRA